MRKTRRLTVILLGVVLGLCGCGKKKVDYNPDKDIETSTNTDSDGNGNYVGGLKKSLHVEDEMQEEFASDAGDQMIIRAKVSVPDINSVSTYSVKALPFDEERCQTMVDMFSDDGKMYSVEFEDMPKQMLQDFITISEATLRRMQQNPNEDQIDVDHQMEEINHLYQLYEAASSDYKEIQPTIGKPGNCEGCDFETEKNGVRYRGALQEGYMAIYPDNWINLYPELQEKYAYAYSEPVNTGFFQGTEDDEEKVVATAVSLAENIGAYGLVEDSVKTLFVKGLPVDGGDYEIIDGDFGYYVTLVRGVDGVALDSRNFVPCYNNYDEMQNGYYETVWDTEKLIVMIDPNFEVLGFHYYGPLTSPEVTASNVELLDYSTIKEIILKELAKNPVRNGNSGSGNPEDGTWECEKITRYNSVDFTYFRIKNPEEERSFTLIPVWCVKGDVYDDYYTYALIINAIDGSRVDTTAETMEYKEWKHNLE